MTLAHVLVLASGGAVGTLLRAGCNAVALRLLGAGFPWGTLAVNVAGSFAFGAIAGYVRTRGGMPHGLETILLVGVLGGFTTYSSYAFQSVELLEHGHFAGAATYIVATNAGALAAVWAGLRLFAS